MYYTSFSTDLCKMIIVGDEAGVSRLHLETSEGNRSFNIDDDWIESTGFFADVIDQIRDYVKGNRKNFAIKLNPQGTMFQKKVWEALVSIPYGEVRSYKEVATKIGNENASRAVGMANGKNPIPIIIPCHRVIGMDGKLTGFAFGLNLKERLLDIEKQSSLGN